MALVRSNWNLKCWLFTEGGKPENPEKNPRGKGENQQPNSTHMKYPSRGLNPRPTGTTAVRGGRITATPPMPPCKPGSLWKYHYCTKIPILSANWFLGLCYKTVNTLILLNECSIWYFSDPYNFPIEMTSLIIHNSFSDLTRVESASVHKFVHFSVAFIALLLKCLFKD
jgi:hypothetical protein